MTNIVYDRFHNCVTVQGHSGSAPIGEDLVCSAVSILVNTLAANVGHMEEARIVTKTVVDIKDGYAKIGCRPAKGFESVVASTFQSVCVGFEIMADKAPEYISFKIKG